MPHEQARAHSMRYRKREQGRRFREQLALVVTTLPGGGAEISFCGQRPVKRLALSARQLAFLRAALCPAEVRDAG